MEHLYTASFIDRRELYAQHLIAFTLFDDRLLGPFQIGLSHAIRRTDHHGPLPLLLRKLGEIIAVPDPPGRFELAHNVVSQTGPFTCHLNGKGHAVQCPNSLLKRIPPGNTPAQNTEKDHTNKPGLILDCSC